MGCCFSRPAGPNSPYPGGPNSGSARAINAAPDTTAIGEDAPETTSRRRHRHDQPLDQHINKPLRRHEWTSTKRTWTRSALTRERIDFFDTRVTGRPEIWQTLHAALQVLWDPAGEGAAEDGTMGLATAQGILMAADITLPTGDLAQGAYDALGNYYALNEWVVADPSNIIEDGEETAREDSKGDFTGEETAEEPDEDAAIRRREEKGKAVVDARDLLTIHVRLSENSQDVNVSINKADAVRVVARKVLQESGLPSTKKIRLAYMGKILKENLNLDEQGWKHGHVVNGLVFNR